MQAKRNSILGSSLEKKISLIEEKLGQLSEFHLQLFYNCRDCTAFHHVVYCRIYLSQSYVCDCLFSVLRNNVFLEGFFLVRSR